LYAAKLAAVKVLYLSWFYSFVSRNKQTCWLLF